MNLLFRLLLTTARESWFSLLLGSSNSINHSYASLLKMLKQKVCLQLNENLSWIVLILIRKTQTLTPKSVTLASTKDAHHSFLDYKHFKKRTQECDRPGKILHSQWISLYTYTEAYTLYKSFSYTITTLLFRLSTYEKIQTSDSCHLQIMCENKLQSYCGNKTVIARYCQAIIHSK